MNTSRFPLLARVGLSAAAGMLLVGGTAIPVQAARPSPKTTITAPTKPTKPAAERKADHQLLMEAYIEASAGVLGMKPQELRDALKGGASLEDLATKKGFTKETFTTAVVKAIKPLLDADVNAHKLTDKQATRFETRLGKGHLPFWTRHHHKRAPKG